jgi:hypothetical protein
MGTAVGAVRTGRGRDAEGRHVGLALGRLLEASGIPDFARRIADYLDDDGFGRVAVVWRLGQGDVSVHDADRLLPHDVQVALVARSNGGWAVDTAHGRVAACIEVQESGDSIGVVLDGQAHMREAVRAQCDLLAPIARAVFEKHRLTESMHALERSEQLQSNLFRIADMASSDMDLGDMLRELHEIVGQFMYA